MKTKPIAVPANWKTAKIHPLAELIEFGSNIDLDAMTEHAKKHGYDKDEALVFFDGMVLEGRHRREICKRIGVIPPCREFVGTNAFAYVAKKIFRQHLTTAERAKIAAKLADMPVGRPELNVPNGTIDSSSAKMTATAAAKALNVSRRSVQRAKAGPTPRKPKPKTGGAIIDWKDFYNHFGSLVRAIVSVGKGYQCQHSDVATNLERRLAAFKEEFTKWVEFHTKEKAPRY